MAYAFAFFVYNKPMIKQGVKSVERQINDTLYAICLAVTYAAIGMSLVRFFSRGEYVSDEINLFYFGVLGLYSLHKEAMHWLMEKEELVNRRKGEYFVFLWLIMTFVLYVVNFATNGYFMESSHGEELHILKEITFTALEVGAIFVASRFLKILRMYITERAQPAAVAKRRRIAKSAENKEV